MPQTANHPALPGLTPVRCDGCSDEIEHCDGLYGSWMHSDTRSEHCTSGGVARPQTPRTLTQVRLRRTA